MIQPKFALGWSVSAFISDDNHLWTISKGDRNPKQAKGLVSGSPRCIVASSEAMFTIANGVLYSFGAVASALMGRTDLNHPLGKVNLPRNVSIKTMASGWNHCIAVADDDTLYVWGDGKYYALGNSIKSFVHIPIPIEISGRPQIIQVACGTRHSLALSSVGDVYAWGSGASGRLGFGSTRDERVPKRIPSLGKGGSHEILQIGCGSSHSMALSKEGFVLSWGAGNFGKLGHGNESDQFSPRVVLSLSPSRLYSKEGNASFVMHRKVCYISCGEFHSLAVVSVLKDEEKHRFGDTLLFGWGGCRHGQLGIRLKGKLTQLIPVEIELEGDSPIVEAFCGLEQTVTVHRDGSIHWLGMNEMVLPDTIRIDVNGLEDARLCQMRILRASGIVKEKIVQIAAGAHHNLCVSSKGFVYGWGQNQMGQLGLGLVSPYSPRPVLMDVKDSLGVTVCVHQISCGSNFSLALASGIVFAWGDNRRGQLGIGKIVDCESFPFIVKALKGTLVESIYCGSEHAAAIGVTRHSTRVLYTWGNYEHGRLGIGSVERDCSLPQLVLLEDIASVSLGESHSLALSCDGSTVFSCGSGNCGQLGRDSEKESWIFEKVQLPLPKDIENADDLCIAAVVAGGHSSLAVALTGEVFVWGSLFGGDERVKQPFEIAGIEVSGTKNISKWIDLSHDVMMLYAKHQNKLLGWGKNTFGKLGIALDESLAQQSFYEKEPVNIDLSRVQVNQLSLGRSHCILLTREGYVYTWGSQSHGRLGRGDPFLDDEGMKDPSIPRIIRLFDYPALTRLQTHQKQQFELDWRSKDLNYKKNKIQTKNRASNAETRLSVWSTEYNSQNSIKTSSFSEEGKTFSWQVLKGRQDGEEAIVSLSREYCSVLNAMNGSFAKLKYYMALESNLLQKTAPQSQVQVNEKISKAVRMIYMHPGWLGYICRSEEDTILFNEKLRSAVLDLVNVLWAKGDQSSGSHRVVMFMASWLDPYQLNLDNLKEMPRSITKPRFGSLFVLLLPEFVRIYSDGLLARWKFSFDVIGLLLSSAQVKTMKSVCTNLFAERANAKYGRESLVQFILRFIAELPEFFEISSILFLLLHQSSPTGEVVGMASALAISLLFDTMTEKYTENDDCLAFMEELEASTAMTGTIVKFLGGEEAVAQICRISGFTVQNDSVRVDSAENDNRSYRRSLLCSSNQLILEKDFFEPLFAFFSIEKSIWEVCSGLFVGRGLDHSFLLESVEDAFLLVSFPVVPLPSDINSDSSFALISACTCCGAFLHNCCLLNVSGGISVSEDEDFEIVRLCPWETIVMKEMLGGPFLQSEMERRLEEMEFEVQQSAVVMEGGTKYLVFMKKAKEKLLQFIKVVFKNVPEHHVPEDIVTVYRRDKEYEFRSFKFASALDCFKELQRKLDEIVIEEEIQFANQEFTVFLYGKLLPLAKSAHQHMLTKIAVFRDRTIPQLLSQMKKGIHSKLKILLNGEHSGGSGWIQSYSYFALRRKRVLRRHIELNPSESGWNRVSKVLLFTRLELVFIYDSLKAEEVRIDVKHGKGRILDSWTILLHELGEGSRIEHEMNPVSEGDKQFFFPMKLVFDKTRLRRLVGKISQK